MTNLLLFFDLLLSSLIIRGFLLFTDRGELELVHGDPFDIPELVKVHGPKGEYLIVFLNFPVKTQAVRDLQKGLVVVW